MDVFPTMCDTFVFDENLWGFVIHPKYLERIYNVFDIDFKICF